MQDKGDDIFEAEVISTKRNRIKDYIGICGSSADGYEKRHEEKNIHEYEQMTEPVIC
uniref:Uncharacterized protein n=1 Tax=Octopus bimaculoides TaxID=37653 RepID=A0A0L8HHS1_OCTBM